MAQNPELKVGDTVYQQWALGIDDGSKARANVSFIVTKISSTTFTLDDGTRFKHGRLEQSLAGTRWQKLGTSYPDAHGDAFRFPETDWPTFTKDEINHVRTEARARRNAERALEVRDMIKRVGIDHAVRKAIATGHGNRIALRNVRELAPDIKEYIEALEYAAGELYRDFVSFRRSVESSASQMRERAAANDFTRNLDID